MTNYCLKQVQVNYMMWDRHKMWRYVDYFRKCHHHSKNRWQNVGPHNFEIIKIHLHIAIMAMHNSTSTIPKTFRVIPGFYISKSDKWCYRYWINCKKYIPVLYRSGIDLQQMPAMKMAKSTICNQYTMRSLPNFEMFIALPFIKIMHLAMFGHGLIIYTYMVIGGCNCQFPIRVTSHEHHGVSKNQQLICLFDSMVRLKTKKTPKFHITKYLWGSDDWTQLFVQQLG